MPIIWKPKKSSARIWKNGIDCLRIISKLRVCVCWIIETIEWEPKTFVQGLNAIKC